MHQNDTKGHQHSSIQIFSFVIVDFSYLVSSFHPHHLLFRVRSRSTARQENCTAFSNIPLLHFDPNSKI